MLEDLVICNCNKDGINFGQLDTLQVTTSARGMSLTLNLLTTTIVAPPSNASKWQMGFNSAFKGLNLSSETYGSNTAQ